VFEDLEVKSRFCSNEAVLAPTGLIVDPTLHYPISVSLGKMERVAPKFIGSIIFPGQPHEWSKVISRVRKVGWASTGDGLGMRTVGAIGLRGRVWFAVTRVSRYS